MKKVKRLRSRRGLTFIEILVAASILGATVVVASAMFPFSHLLQDRSSGYSRASSVLQRKLEQVRSLETQQLNPSGLRTAGIIDSGTSTSGPYSFNTVDQIATRFVQGTSALTVTGAGTDLVRVDVSITWKTSRGRQHTVNAMTYVADKTVWREP